MNDIAIDADATISIATTTITTISPVTTSSIVLLLLLPLLSPSRIIE